MKIFNSVLVMIILWCVGMVYFLGATPSVEASQPMLIKQVYVTEDFRVWCESPSGDKIYVSKVAPGAGGVHMVVVVGGCK